MRLRHTPAVPGFGTGACHVAQHSALDTKLLATATGCPPGRDKLLPRPQGTRAPSLSGACSCRSRPGSTATHGAQRPRPTAACMRPSRAGGGRRGPPQRGPAAGDGRPPEGRRRHPPLRASGGGRGPPSQGRRRGTVPPPPRAVHSWASAPSGAPATGGQEAPNRPGAAPRQDIQDRGTATAGRRPRPVRLSITRKNQTRQQPLPGMISAPARPGPQPKPPADGRCAVPRPSRPAPRPPDSSPRSPPRALSPRRAAAILPPGPARRVRRDPSSLSAPHYSRLRPFSLLLPKGPDRAALRELIRSAAEARSTRPAALGHFRTRGGGEPRLRSIRARQRSALFGSASDGLGSRSRRGRAEPAARGSLGPAALRRRSARSGPAVGDPVAGDDGWRSPLRL